MRPSLFVRMVVYASTVFRSRDVLSWLLLGLIATEATLAVLNASQLGRLGAVIAVIASTLAYAFRRMNLVARAVVQSVTSAVPMSVSLSRDDEGHVTALVQRQDGNPEVIEVPDEVAAHGPEAVAEWLVAYAVERGIDDA